MKLVLNLLDVERHFPAENRIEPTRKLSTCDELFRSEVLVFVYRIGIFQFETFREPTFILMNFF